MASLLGTGVKPGRRVHLAARVEEQAFTQLAELARRNDRSLSAEVRRAVRRHIDSERETT